MISSYICNDNLSNELKMPDLTTELKYLPGIGPKRAELFLKFLEIQTVRDLLFFFPYKHIDRGRVFKIKELSPDMPYVQLIGRISNIEVIGTNYKQRLKAKLTDDSGTIELVWFQGVKWVKQSIEKDKEYLIFGKPQWFNGLATIAHPEIEEPEKADKKTRSQIQAIYSIPEKLKSNFITSRTVQKILSAAIVQYLPLLKETLPQTIIDRYKLLSLSDAIFNIHFPRSSDFLKNAEFRLKFEELFYIQLQLQIKKANRKYKTKGLRFDKVGELFHHFYKHNLTFELTEDQKKVIREIRMDMGSGLQMNRLLQGDVGSGKTLVALMCSLICIDNEYQACLMVPTEILAIQHYKNISRQLSGLDIEIALLTGSTRKSDRDLIFEKLQEGKIAILIGTHAILEDPVVFKNLGLAIIDEQHRFGVAQRAILKSKNESPPHMLVMTATPIPRTLAMTLYSDLDVSKIIELPPGRKPIKTIHFYNKNRNKVNEFLISELKKGRQIYIVYPLINESEKLDYKALEEGFEQIQQTYEPMGFRVEKVHGKMKTSIKDQTMQEFSEAKVQVLVATTVIEVGVDVPNATIMVIESAERFGLAQLHQLRGRVGRGSEQSFCILVTGFKLSEVGRKRIGVMCETNDGFYIAEQDLKMRGHGSIEGTQQSGLPLDLKIANLAHDDQILKLANQVAVDIAEKDPELKMSENIILAYQINHVKKQHYEWHTIA